MLKIIFFFTGIGYTKSSLIIKAAKNVNVTVGVTI